MTNSLAMTAKQPKDWFEHCLNRYPDLPSVMLIRSVEMKLLPVQFLNPPVLDLCCGDGFFARCLGMTGIYGCDIDEKAVEQARRLDKTYRRVWTSDARDLKSIKDCQFNSVIANCSLEHIAGIGPALHSIARVLKPGGRLVMSVPSDNLNAWFFPNVLFKAAGLARYGRRLCEEYNRKQQHINICSLESWTSELETSGLIPEQHFYAFPEWEYKLVTFFESFNLDSFPGNFLAGVDRILRKGIPLRARKFLWRMILKRIYLNAKPVESGGELFIVAKKETHLPVKTTVN